MNNDELITAFWADVTLLGESMNFIEIMAMVQRSSGTGFVEDWKRGEITPRLADVYDDFVAWCGKTDNKPVSVFDFVIACEGLGFKVKTIARTWLKGDTPSLDRHPTCLIVPGLKSLRESLQTAEIFASDRYAEQKAA